MADPTRILVVANRTAVAPRLLDEVRRRAKEGPCEFTLLIPAIRRHGAADWRLETALPLMQRAALRCPVEGLAGGPDPYVAIKEAVDGGRFDEIIVSTLRPGASRWLGRDLLHRIDRLGLPVTHVMPGSRRPSSGEAFDTLLEIGAAGGAGMAVPPSMRERHPKSSE
jgi:hypothetical protein